MTIKMAEDGIRDPGNSFLLQVIPLDSSPRLPHRQAEDSRLSNSGDFLAGLHSANNRDQQDSTSISMYRQGYEWGINDMKRFTRKLCQEVGNGQHDVWRMNRKYLLESCWWPLTTEAWGGWQARFDFENSGVVVVTLRNPVVEKNMDQADRPTCPMYAGMFAGIFTVIDGEERGGIETRCYSMEDDSCQFAVGPSRQIDAFEFWRHDGGLPGESPSYPQR